MVYPMFAMVLLTFIVAILAVKARFASVKNKTVSVKYYQLMEGGNIPESVTKTTRHFNNLFEIPVLFYVVCTLYITLGLESTVALVFAWLFVSFRIAHAYIHITYNHILHRMLTFWAGFICVMALWIIFLILQM